MFEVGEKKVPFPKTSLINQYSFLSVVKSETEDELAAILANHDGKLFIKAIYFSPTSNMHVAYVLSNIKILTKE